MGSRKSQLTPLRSSSAASLSLRLTGDVCRPKMEHKRISTKLSPDMPHKRKPYDLYAMGAWRLWPTGLLHFVIQSTH